MTPKRGGGENKSIILAKHNILYKQMAEHFPVEVNLKNITNRTHHMHINSQSDKLLLFGLESKL